MLKVTVVEAGTGARAQFDASGDEPLLDQLEREVPFKFPNLCWMGACGTCALRVTAGIEHLETDAFGVGATVQMDPGWVLPCSAGACQKAVDDEERYHVLVEV